MRKIFFTALVSLASLPVWSWGGRGHHTICHSAVFLLQEEGLRDFLKTRPHLMGHLCNIPDFYWKTLSPELTKLGNPTHFIDVEITGLGIQDISIDYKAVVEQFTGKPNQFKKDSTIFSVPTELGSIWWRADQFYRRAVGSEKDLKQSAVPSNSKEEQDDKLPYNIATYDFIVNLGLMGHFVGDASQPYHASADYDGYFTGHGGIHAYYEDLGVSAIGPDLEIKINKAAKNLIAAAQSKNKKTRETVPFLSKSTVIENMKALTEVSFKEIGDIQKIDPVLKPSEQKMEKGMSLRTPAERKDIKTVAGQFEPYIVREMARSAALLAKIWDQAYVQVGRPKLTAYKSYKYPFTPDFVIPDYFDDKSVKK